MGRRCLARVSMAWGRQRPALGCVQTQEKGEKPSIETPTTIHDIAKSSKTKQSKDRAKSKNLREGIFMIECKRASTKSSGVDATHDLSTAQP